MRQPRPLGRHLLTQLVIVAIALVLGPASVWAQGFQALFTKDGTDIWAVGDNGAVWRSYDSGATWRQTHTLNSVMNHGVAARGLVALVVSDGGHIYRSTNNGGTWTDNSMPGTPDIYGVEFPTSQVAFACGGGGSIFASNDGGQSWNPQTSGTAQRLNAIRFRDASNGWAVGYGGVVLHTTNGGANWAPVAIPTSNELLSVDFFGSTVWVVGVSGTCLKSTNDGANWTPVNLGLDSQGDVRSVWLESATNVTITGGGGFVRTSTNGGTSWTWADHPLLGDGSDYFAFGGTKAWVCSGKQRAIPRTTNGGLSWSFPAGVNATYDWQQRLLGPPVITRGNTFATTPQNRDHVWCVIGPYVYKSRDRGFTWNVIDTIPGILKTNSFCVSAKDTNKWVAAVGTPDRIMRTTDGGINWTTTISSDFSEYGMPLEQHPDKPDTLLFATENGRLYRSKDFGTSWDTLSIPMFRSPCDIVIVPGDDSKIIIADGVTGVDFGQIWQSTNGGLNFTLRYTGESSEVPCVWGNRHQNNVLFAANWSSGGVWRSIDYGQNWSQISAVSSAWGGATSRDDPRATSFNRYAGSPNYLSLDQGLSFTSMPLTSPGSGYALIGLDRSNWLDLHSAGIYRLAVTQTQQQNFVQDVTVVSPNGGENWTIGSVHAVTWTSLGIGLVRIEYRTGPAQPWVPVADVEGYLGTYNWTIPATPTLTAELRVSDSWDGSPVDASNSAFAITGPLIDVSPASIAFGSHPVNSVTTDSVVVTNLGNAPLHVTPIATGTSAFWPGRSSLTLAAGATDTIGVFFKPLATQAYADTVVLTSDGGAPVRVALSGLGENKPQLVLNAPIASSAWKYNTTQNIVWQSQGVTQLAIEYRTGEAQPWIEVANPVAASAGQYAWLIPNAPTTTARVRVRQVPSGLEAISPLFLLSAPSFALSVNPLDFGTVPVDYAHWDTLHITNSGNAPLIVSGIASDNPDFWPTRSTFSVPAGRSDTLGVYFKPSAKGPEQGTLTLTTDDPGAPHTLTVQGIGGVQVDTGALPLAFAFEPARPNPFTGSTVLRYSVPTDAIVRLEVFDLAGRRVTTLVDGDKPPGTYAVTFDPRAVASQGGSAPASGVYFARFTGAKFSRTLKLLYLPR